MIFFKRKGTQISTSMPPIPPTVACHTYKDATHASMLPTPPRTHALARHPCKHATHATHAGSYSTPFLKLDNLSWFSFQMNSKHSEQVHTHYHQFLDLLANSKTFLCLAILLQTFQNHSYIHKDKIR